MKKLREDPETAAVADRLPDAPELLEENERSWKTWNIVRLQVRLGPKGVFAADLAAVIAVLQVRLQEWEDIEWELTKMRELFFEAYIKEH